MDFRRYMKFSIFFWFPIGLHTIFSPQLKPRKPRKEIGNVVYITATVIISILSCIYMNKFNKQNPYKTMKILYMFRVVRTIISASIVLGSFKLNKTYTKVARIVCDIESNFGQLGIPDNLSNRYKRTFIYYGTSVVFTCAANLLEHVDEPMSYVFWETWNQFFCHSVNFLIASNVTVLSHVFMNRLTKLKQILVHIKDDEAWEMYKKEPMELFLIVSKTYEEIFYAIQSINTDLTPPVFFIYIIDLLQILLVPLIIQESEFIYKAEIVESGMMLLFFYIMLRETSQLKIMAMEITPVFSECKAAYTDIGLSTAKNTFLFQQLHQDISVSFFGFLDINLETFMDHLSQGISWIIFFFQIANKL